MKKLLIVVDYQYDFVEGSLGFSKAKELEERIYNKIQEYKSNNDEVIFTLDTHKEDYMQTQEGEKLPIVHCVEGTLGIELYGKVKEAYSEEMKVFNKTTFGSLELANYLKDKEYERIELVGLVSNICVISNAILVKSALPEVLITIDSSCTASNDDELNQKALDVLKGLQFEVK